MAKFVLLVLLLIIAAGTSTKLPLPIYGNDKVINILSIDSGGIKGIIPAVVLDHLDKALKAKDSTTSIAKYFDVIAGTSIGAQIAAFLTSSTQSSNGTFRPPLTPADIVQFYKINGPHLFNSTRAWLPSSPYPQYDGEYLQYMLREALQETRLSQTLTNVVITTYDVKKVKPIIFSSFKLKTDPSLDAKLSDICIGSSSAPQIFPPYYFQNDDHEFNLIDGGMVAFDPTLIAVNEVIHQNHNEPTKFRLVSIGTGETNNRGQFDAEAIAKWSGWDWSAHSFDFPTHTIDYYLATMFPYDYLRIQEYNLNPSMSNPDNGTKENMENLEKEGHKLLQQNVLKFNVDTFAPEETNLGTNAEALERLAEILYEERKIRLKNRAMEKRGKGVY